MCPDLGHISMEVIKPHKRIDTMRLCGLTISPGDMSCYN